MGSLRDRVGMIHAGVRTMRSTIDAGSLHPVGAEPPARSAMERLRSLLPASLVAIALIAIVSAAHAQGGINLSWNDCGGFGTLNKTFACNTNNGVSTMYGSAVSGADMPQLNGQSSVLDVQST